VERQEYALRIMLSKANPEKYGSVTIDGSDQACYGLPYFSQKTHDRCNSNTEKYYNIILELYHVLNLIFVWLCSSKGRKIKTRLYGAIWHGAFMACFAYNACLEGGSNVQVG
jgi:hypothetical protein